MYGKDKHFDNFHSQHMNRVPLAVFILEEDSNYDINTGTAFEITSSCNNNNIIILFYQYKSCAVLKNNQQLAVFSKLIN